MKEEFLRTAMILGEDSIDKLNKATVAVFGLGGVGGYVVEALARCGVGKLVITDNDTVSVSNINRQIIALHSTVGMYKTDAITARVKDINPDIEVEAHTCFYLPDNHDDYDFASYDYVVDCIDTVAAKIDIIIEAQKHKTKVISSMGTGNKLDPTRLEIADIYKTSYCPLAKVMRHELKKRNVKKLDVLYSKEEPLKAKQLDDSTQKRSVPGSTAFVPPAAGLIIASKVIKDLL